MYFDTFNVEFKLEGPDTANEELKFVDIDTDNVEFKTVPSSTVNDEFKLVVPPITIFALREMSALLSMPRTPLIADGGIELSGYCA